MQLILPSPGNETLAGHLAEAGFSWPGWPPCLLSESTPRQPVTGSPACLACLHPLHPNDIASTEGADMKLVQPNARPEEHHG